ncbi:MAG: P1 family peptidase, partial [Merdibacter sp.]|nr:P1 family peptidase [Merdibacter sp.]
MNAIDISAIHGVQVGQATDALHGTGCTVILCPQGACAGVDVRGGGPATRETDLLDPRN